VGEAKRLMAADDDRNEQLHALGAFIRAQRRLANLSLRQMADLAHVSNPYLSQLERGLHEPSVRVLQAIRADSQLTDDQKQALLVVYRSYVAANATPA
jgi:transcriptional regulator with XRE-family HTH domain